MSMSICSDGHDEICFVDNKCPCCELKADRDKWKDKFSDLEDASAGEIEDLEDKIRVLEDRE